MKVGDFDLNGYYVGDCRDLLRRLPDESVQCVVTSPPYWNLRDYGVAGQIGLEETPEEFVAIMVDIFREVRRVLRADGTLWLNLGDTYVSAPHGDTHDPKYPAGRNRDTDRAIRKSFRHDKASVVPVGHASAPRLKPKDLVGIPWRVAFALQADGWYLRSDNIWHKPNPMPESVNDRTTRAHEYVFLLSKSERYAYDADAIKEPTTGNAHSRGGGLNPKALGKNETSADRRRVGFNERYRVKQNASFAAACSGLVDRRNKRSVWTIASEPTTDAHFATFPRKLVEVCILAGCPVGGIVLDPFGGSGTVGRVAEDLGRKWLLFDLNPKYAAIAARKTAQTGLLGRIASGAAR